MARVLIAGCGYVGNALARTLIARGDEVFGLSRKPDRLAVGVQPVPADLTQIHSLYALPPALDSIVYCASADDRTATDYHRIYVQGPRNLQAALARQGQRPGRMLFVSSTGVYAQQHGEWVDETAPTDPWHFTGRLLLEAEASLLQTAANATIVRFSGIYGPGRERLLRRLCAGEPLSPLAHEHYTNRIHRDDCAGVLAHLLAHPAPHQLYVASDCEPATEFELAQWVAQALERPLAQTSFAALLHEGERSNKRCRNTRLLASGYRFNYPTFREGYRALLTAAAA